jgi:hypothetical protein
MFDKIGDYSNKLKKGKEKLSSNSKSVIPSIKEEKQLVKDVDSSEDIPDFGEKKKGRPKSQHRKRPLYNKNLSKVGSICERKIILII